MSEHVETRRCTACNIEKLITDFGFVNGKRTRRSTHCRRCKADYQCKRSRLLVAAGIDPNARRAERAALRRLQSPPKPLPPEGMKFCSRCKKAKILDDFDNNNSATDGKSARCKQCDREVDRERREKYRLAPGVIRTEKYCCGCKSVKQASEFGTCRGNRDWLQTLCKPCARKAARKHSYGLTEDQRISMLEAQGYLCAICGRVLDISVHDAANPQMPNVDHCHKTGEVRGILCGLCNRTLGGAEHGDWMERASRYLAKYGGKRKVKENP